MGCKQRFYRAIATGLLCLGLGLGSGCTTGIEGQIRRDRDYVSSSVNYSELNINGETYEEGSSFSLDANFEIETLEQLTLNPQLNLNHQSYGMLDGNGSETITDFNLSLGARTNLYHSQRGPRSLEIYLGFGGEYLMNHEAMVYQGQEGHISRHNAGPVLAFGLKSEHLNLSLSVSKLFGQRSSNFDVSRDLGLEHISLSVSGRVGKVELPVRVDFLHGVINDKPPDRHSFFVRLNFQPGIEVTDHISIFVNLTYLESFKREEYWGLDLGGGIKITLEP